MEKKFNKDVWESRCRTCVNAKFSKALQIVVCTKQGDCSYKKKDGPLTIDYSQEKGIKVEKIGKVCPGCGIWYPFEQMVANKVIPETGKKYYTYCKGCKRDMFRKYRKKGKEDDR